MCMGFHCNVLKSSFLIFFLSIIQVLHCASQIVQQEELCVLIFVITKLSKLAQLVPLPYSRGRSTRYSDRLHDFSVTIPRCYKDVYVNSFFPRTARLWNSLPIECFPLTYDLSGFKSRINRYLLTVGSF